MSTFCFLLSWQEVHTFYLTYCILIFYIPSLYLHYYIRLLFNYKLFLYLLSSTFFCESTYLFFSQIFFALFLYLIISFFIILSGYFFQIFIITTIRIFFLYHIVIFRFLRNLFIRLFLIDYRLLCIQCLFLTVVSISSSVNVFSFRNNFYLDCF